MARCSVRKKMAASSNVKASAAATHSISASSWRKHRARENNIDSIGIDKWRKNNQTALAAISKDRHHRTSSGAYRQISYRQNMACCARINIIAHIAIILSHITRVAMLLRQSARIKPHNISS